MEAMSFADDLWTWSAEELAYLMERRPDLLPASDRGLEAVARKAATAMSLGRVLVGADVGMLVVAEALVARHPATVDDLDDLLGTADTSAVLDAVDRLRRSGVVMVEGWSGAGAAVIVPVGALRDLLHRPLGLGPSFSELADNLSTEILDGLAAATNATGAGQRSPTIRAIGHRLSDPTVVEQIMRDAPAEARDLLAELVAHRSPAIPLPTGYPYRGLDADDPLAWLMDAGLVIAVTEAGAELPRELVIAGMPDGLAPTAALRPIELESVDGLAADVVSGSAGDGANRLLDGAETLLRMIGNGEVSIRKAGGIGPREIKRLAKSCGLETLDVARLIELLALTRLLKVDGGSLAASDLAVRWWTLPRKRRYLVLVRAWLASDRFLSRGLVEAEDPDRVAALGDIEPVAAAAAGRQVTLSTICRLEDGAAFRPEQLAAVVVWQGPNLWGAGEPPPEVLVDWTLEEAELLGLIADDAPGPILRALMASDEAGLDLAIEATVAEDQDKLVLQSDMTAVAFGPLAPSVGRSLSDMTERDEAMGDGRAPAFRFSESSVRRAFDRGWDAQSITGFLTEHSLSGVPQPLEYLLADVARRYGAIRVMPAQSIIVTTDDVAAVEVASNRKAANLGLRLVAPTVLTSPLDPVTVTEALRALGLFPTLEGSSIAIDGTRRADGDDPGDEHGAADLPADWTGPPLPTGPFPDEVSAAVAVLIGEGADPDPGGGTAQSTNDTDALQGFWGRTVQLDAVIDGVPTTILGTLVGIGNVVSVLAADGIVDIAAETILAVSDPESD